MYRTLRKCRFDALYGLARSGSAGASACSGFKPMKPAPRGASQRISALKSPKSPMPQLPPRAHRVQLHGNAPQPPAVEDRGRLVALGRAKSADSAAAAPPAILHVEFVIARRQLDRQFEAAAGDPRALDLAAPESRDNRRWKSTPLAPRPVLEVHRPEQTRAEFPRGDIDIDADARAVRGGDRRQERAPARDLESAAARAPSAAGSSTGAAHGAQDRLLGLEAEVTAARRGSRGRHRRCRAAAPISRSRLVSTIQHSSSAALLGCQPILARLPEAPAPRGCRAPCRIGISKARRPAAPARRRSAPNRRRSAAAAGGPAGSFRLPNQMPKVRRFPSLPLILRHLGAAPHSARSRP